MTYESTEFCSLIIHNNFDIANKNLFMCCHNLKPSYVWNLLLYTIYYIVCRSYNAIKLLHVLDHTKNFYINIKVYVIYSNIYLVFECKLQFPAQSTNYSYNCIRTIITSLLWNEYYVVCSLLGIVCSTIIHYMEPTFHCVCYIYCFLSCIYCRFGNQVNCTWIYHILWLACGFLK